MTAEEYFNQETTLKSIGIELASDDISGILTLMQEFASLKCKEQRSICANEAMVDGGCNWGYGACSIDKESILNSPEPKL